MSNTSSLHPQAAGVLDRNWEGKLFHPEDLDRIYLSVDGTLDHLRDDRSAHAARAVERDIQHAGPGDEPLVLLVEFEIDHRFRQTGKRDAADERRVVIAGECERRVDLSVAEPNGRANSVVLPKQLDDLFAGGCA